MSRICNICSGLIVESSESLSYTGPSCNGHNASPDTTSLDIIRRIEALEKKVELLTKEGK